MSEACAECGATFAGPAELVEHQKQAHPAGAPEPSTEPLTSRPMGAPTHGAACGLCGQTFERGEDLAVHVRSAHSGELETSSAATTPA